MTRELRKRFQENKKQLLAGKHDEIYEQLATEFAEFNPRYSKETDHGTIEWKQAEWETRIRDELAMLADFCRTCRPTRKR